MRIFTKILSLGFVGKGDSLQWGELYDYNASDWWGA